MNTESVSARIPSEYVVRLRKLAEDDDRSFSYMLTKAVKHFLESMDGPEPPTPHLAAVPLDLPTIGTGHPAAFHSQTGQSHPATYNAEANTLHVGPASPADLFPEDEEVPKSTPALINVEHPVLTNDSHLLVLKERLANSKSGKEIDELTREITRIEGARTLAILNALPGADPAYVASREANET